MPGQLPRKSTELPAKTTAMTIALLAALPVAVSAQGVGALQEVVVTAQMRSENLQEVPIAASAFSAERLNELGAVRLTDLSTAAPSFSVERASNVDTVFIRGVGGGGRNIGFGGRAGVYLDGVYIGQTNAIDQTLADVERVEILRGPQGTLFGRNTVSGAVSIVTRAPQREFQAGVNVKVGNYRDRAGGAYVNGPIAEAVAGKLSVFTERRDGFTLNLYDGNVDIGKIAVDSVRGALRFGSGSDLSVDVAGDFTRDHSLRGIYESVSGTTGTGTVDPFAPLPYQVNDNDLPVREQENYGGSATVNFHLTSMLSLTSISAYREVRAFRHNDNDYAPLSMLFTDYTDRFDQFTQELRLASGADGDFRFVAGVFFLTETANTYRTATAGSDAAGRLPIAPGAVSLSSGEIKTDSYAAYANVNYDIVTALRLDAGARFTYERRNLLFNLDGARSGGFGIGVLPNFRDSDDENHVTPSISLTYSFADDANVYAKYSQGFKSGGWNVDFLNVRQITFQPGGGTPFAFDTETADSFELGMKSEWFARRLRVNAALFATDYEDYQTNQFVAYPGGATVIQLNNAAKVETRGAELSVEAYLVEDLRANVDASYLDAEFDSFPGGGAAGADATGNRLPYAPRLSGSFGVTYALPMSLFDGKMTLFGQYAYRDSTYTSQENTSDQLLPSYGIYNGYVGWRSAQSALEMMFRVQNIADKDYLVNRARDFLGTATVTHSDPRTYGLEVKARF
jgi:iron complex outermembrane recepter protein